MMDVDQPVPSTNEKEDPALDAVTAQTLMPEKSQGMVGRENDELPALLISDSDEDDPAKVPMEANDKLENEKPEPAEKAGGADVSSGNISGITPMEATVVSEVEGRDREEEGDVEKDDPEKAETLPASEAKKPEPVASDLSVANDEDVTLVENIDLTGVSSAEESSISEPSGEKPTQREKKMPPTPVKSSSEMTAQELLESLLGAQEEAFAAHRASDANRSDLIEFADRSTVNQRKDGGERVEDDSVVVLDDTSVCVARIEPKEHTEQSVTNQVTSLQTDSQNIVQPAASSDTEKGSQSDMDEPAESGENGANSPAANEPEDEDGSNIVTITDDECCLLEEMPNESVSQVQKERNASNKSPCVREEVEGSDKSSDTVERNNVQDGKDNANNTDVNEMDENETFESNEPPRKKARSMSVASELPTEPVDNTFARRECDFQTDKDQSAEDAVETDDLTDRLDEASIAQAKLQTDLLEAQVKSAAIESLQHQNSDGNSATGTGLPDELNASENSNPANKPNNADGAEAVDKAKELTVCPDVMVIDDDEDIDTKSEAACNDNKVKTMDSATNIAKEKPKPAATLKKSEMESAIPLSPVPPELKTEVPLKMEFVRRFCKPLKEMTRSDLEQLVLQKITEAMVYKSDNAALRAIIKKQAIRLHGFERSLADVTGHYEALKLVADRAVEDMKKRANVFVAPVKITRAVGLQVSRCGSSTEMFKSANAVSGNSGKRKVESVTVAMATGAVNGVCETNSMREQPSEPVKRAVQQTAAGVQRSTAVTPVRHQVSPSGPQLVTTRTSPNVSSTANGVVPSFKPYVAKLSNNVATVATVTTPSQTIRFQMNSHGSDATTPTATTFANVVAASPSSGNNAGGADGPVRKKQLHKITPMRPPLSAYQQAQQEKQARQQQELLVQQIQEQNQQVQRKAQTNARSDVPAVENAVARPATDNRPRPVPNQQARVLNANLNIPATTSLQLVPISALRNPSVTVSSTTPPSTQKRSSPQTSSTVVSSSVDDSLIDLTEEDEAQGVEGMIVATNIPKRPRPSTNGPQSIAVAQPNVSIPASQIASNQLLRIQSKISKPDAGGSTPSTMASNIPTAGVYQHENGDAVRPILNAKRVNAPPLQTVRQLVYTNCVQRPPGLATDQPMLKKRVIVKPAIQALIVPLPPPGPQPENDPSWKLGPPQPTICVNNVQTGIVISWLMPRLTDKHAEIENYQIYAYQEVSSSGPTGATEEWRHVGDVKALLLPMAVTLTQFQEGQRYYFAVRAIDKHKRVGMFSDPRTWSDTNSVSNV